MYKIGILTIHDTVNYGSLLQTYATYSAIKQLSDNVEIINYECQAIETRETTYPLKRVHNLQSFVKYLIWHPMLQKKKNCFQKFSVQQMKLSPRYDRNSISKANERYDMFIVGSDIVWGMNITGCDYSFFLDFVEDKKKKHSFSSSIGTVWEEKDKPEIQRCLRRFDSISVREQLASEWIEELLGNKVPVTCDPTMLWPMDFWDNMSENSYAPKGKYVLIYLTTKDKVNIRDGIAYAKKKGIKAYYIDFNHLKPVKNLKIVKPASIQQWIALIANAEAVFSASYHGLLFSLYFHRNVFYYNRGNTSRMISLCKELNIENHEGKKEFIAADAPIDYEFVDRIFVRKREDSWEYLKTILEYSEVKKF